MGSLQQRFREWDRSLDAAALRGVASPAARAFWLLALGGLVVLGAWSPGSSAHLGLDGGSAVVGLGAMTIVLGALTAWGAALPAGVSLVVLQAALAFFLAGLVGWSTGDGPAVFSVVLLFVAGIVAAVGRGTWRHPYLAIAAAMAVVVGLAAGPLRGELKAYALLVPTVVGVSLLAGALGDRVARDRDQARQARDGQLAVQLELEREQLAWLTLRLADLLSLNHDVNNVLTAAVLNADIVHASLNQGFALEREALQEVAAALHSQVKSVQHEVETTPIRGRPESGWEATVVEVAPVLESVCAVLRAKFPSAELRIVGCEGLRVSVQGGDPSLARMLENVIRNAAQGDGNASGHIVTVEAAPDVQRGLVRLSIVDDGPGFRADILQKPLTALATSRPSAPGLGLFMAAALARASGGNLERSNPPGGGARVDLELPLAVAPKV